MKKKDSNCFFFNPRHSPPAVGRHLSQSTSASDRSGDDRGAFSPSPASKRRLALIGQRQLDWLEKRTSYLQYQKI
jgi:hypothetical protein